MSLHVAAMMGNIPRIRQLVDAGDDVDARDEDGMVPLHYAVQYNKPSAAKCLLEFGCRRDVTDESGIVKFWYVHKCTPGIFCVSCTNSDFDANYVNNAVFHADSQYDFFL